MFEQIGLFSLDRNPFNSNYQSCKIRIYETNCSLMEFNNWDYMPFYQMLTDENIHPKFKSYMPAHHYDTLVKFFKDNYALYSSCLECIKISQIEKLDEYVTIVPPIKTLYMVPYNEYDYSKLLYSLYQEGGPPKPYKEYYANEIQDTIRQFLEFTRSTKTIAAYRYNEMQKEKEIEEKYLYEKLYKFFMIDSVLELVKYKYTAKTKDWSHEPVTQLKVETHYV